MEDIYETAPELKRKWSDWEPGFGIFRYYRRTFNRDYTPEQSLEMHHNRWSLMLANFGYGMTLAGIVAVACR